MILLYIETGCSQKRWYQYTYGQNRQFAPPKDTTALLDKAGIKHTQQTVGSFLYYGRAVDNTGVLK